MMRVNESVPSPSSRCGVHFDSSTQSFAARRLPGDLQRISLGLMMQLIGLVQHLFRLEPTRKVIMTVSPWQ